MKTILLTVNGNGIKLFVVVLCFMLFAACNQQNSNAKLQAQIDSLKAQSAINYKPGLGELMLAIQIHHGKVWFAGENQNWVLATFELRQIKETFDKAKKYCSQRPDIKLLPIIYPSMDSVSNAIKAKNRKRFATSFAFLTASCNNCHQSSSHPYLVIKIPETPPYTNQEYKAK